MFLIYINDIGENITSNLRLFADDSLVYLAIETPQDCLTLQKDLDKLSLWASKWQMTFNVTKCKTLSITRKRNPIYRQYSMNNQLLESVRNHPYLGVEVTQKLNWSNHIDHIMAKPTDHWVLSKETWKDALRISKSKRTSPWYVPT